MKRLKKILCLILIMGIALSFTNTKSVAAEVQYTNNVIPVMTSNTSPSGKASASSIWTETYTYSAYKAFDRVNSDQVSGWATARNVNTGWLEYDFPTEMCITKYTITPRDWAEKINDLP